MKIKGAPSIGQLRTKVTVTTTLEVPEPATPGTDIDHPPVFTCMAKLEPLKASKVLDWKAVFGDEVTPTHQVLMRFPPDVKIDLRHYLLAQDCFGDTWYRVRAVEDLEGRYQWLRLLVTVVSLHDNRTDPVTQEFPPRAPDYGIESFG